MRRDWLYPFLQETVGAFSFESAKARLEAFRQKHPGLDRRILVRRYIEHRLRERGVVYGTPLVEEEALLRLRDRAKKREAVFLALQRVQVELALEVGQAADPPIEGAWAVRGLLCYALFCRDEQAALRIHACLPQLQNRPGPTELLQKLARRIERRLEARAYLAGNPLLGLPIHNSFSYTDAKTFCRLAIATYEAGRPDRLATRRVFEYRDRERRLLLQAFLGLAQAEQLPGSGLPLSRPFAEVMREQIRASDLPRRTQRELQAMLTAEVSPLAVAAAVGDDRTRDFLIEQLVLASMLDGYVSRAERLFIADLAGWLGVSPEEVARVEATVVAFFEAHQDFLDLFTVGSAVRDYRQRMLDRLQIALTENLGLIVDEIRAKGDLADLLVRASTEPLSDEEWARVRQGLLDVVRVVPSLAIFSLPGGVVLLPLLFKILPDGLKPRALAERRTRPELEEFF